MPIPAEEKRELKPGGLAGLARKVPERKPDRFAGYTSQAMGSRVAPSRMSRVRVRALRLGHFAEAARASRKILSRDVA